MRETLTPTPQMTFVAKKWGNLKKKYIYVYIHKKHLLQKTRESYNVREKEIDKEGLDESERAYMTSYKHEALLRYTETGGSFIIQ